MDDGLVDSGFYLYHVTDRGDVDWCESAELPDTAITKSEDPDCDLVALWIH